MSDVATTTLGELATPVLTGEWLTWNDEQAAEFSTLVHAAVKVVGMLRQRHDEQLDTAQAVGKFVSLERVRKARNSEDEGPKVDPLAALLAS